MKRSIWRCAGLVVAAALPAAGAWAQLDHMMGKGGHGLDLKGMAGMASSPMASGSMGNVAGLLQYCIGNNYLSGDSAASVKDQLMGKLPGGEKTDDRSYSDGQKGLLHGSNGNLMDLSSGGGLTADVTKKACDVVLAQGKSFLGAP
jgi:hypothetical protein